MARYQFYFTYYLLTYLLTYSYTIHVHNYDLIKLLATPLGDLLRYV